MFALIAIWALAEATLFFVVADVPIMALGIKAGWEKALVGAGIAAVASAIGGCLFLYQTAIAHEELYGILLHVPGINPEVTEEARWGWEQSGVWGMMVGSFSGVPYKLYAFWAATTHPGSAWMPSFFLASILARLPRFALVALVAGWAGPRLVERLGARLVWSGFLLGWAGFYALYWSVMGF